MTNSRTELLRVLTEISQLSPDLRLGQLIAILAMRARGPEAEAIWDCEDDEFLPAARRMLEHYQRCASEPVAAAVE